MGYRIVRIAPAWLRLLWPQDQLHDRSVLTQLGKLERLPGVLRSLSYVDLPVSTWQLPRVQELLRMIGVGAPYVTRPEIGTWAPKRALYDYQQRAVDQILAAPSGFLLGDQMGLGKTTPALTAANTLRQHYGGRPVVIVSTLSSRGVWQREREALGAEGTFCALDSRDVTHPSWDPRADWYFIHFDIALAWFSLLQNRRPCCVIVDEAHYARNGRAQRARGVAAVAGVAPHRILLTGTPIENRPADLWHLLSIVDGPRAWGSPVDFRVRYAGATSDGYGYKDGEPTHMEELQQRLRHCYLRRTTADVAHQLPGLRRVLHRVPLKPGLRHEHDEVLSAAHLPELLEAVRKGTLQADVLQTLTRLRQVTSDGKIEATVELVANAQAQGEGVVVFVWEQDVARRIATRLSGAFCVTGEHPQAVRQQVIDNFQATPGSVLVATLGALRESVTLHTARIVVLHDLHWILAHLLQAEARVWRTGQKRACESFWVVGDDSFDILLLQALYAKGKAAQAIKIDDGIEALRELGVEALVQGEQDRRIREMLAEWT